MLLLLIGIGCTLGGPLLDQAIQAAKLDAVLSPDELQDENIRKQTQDLIRRTEKQYWPLWLLLGLTILTISTIGLKSTPATNTTTPQ